MTSLASHFVKIQLHPLNYCAAGLALSIAFAGTFLLWILTGIVFIVLFFLINRNQNKKWIFFIALIYIGGALHYHSVVNSHKEFIAHLSTASYTMRGTILSLEPQDGVRTKQKITIQTESFHSAERPVYIAKKKIQMYLVRPTKARVGDIIEIADFSLNKNKNKSYDDYLIKENIASTVFLPSLDYRLIKRPAFSLSRGLFYFKQNLLLRCKRKLSPSTFSFFASVFLGNKAYGKKQMEEPKDNCKTWGISHYLARSGLHLVIFIWIWFFFLNLLPIPFFLKQILLISLGVLYHLLSWPSISFVRAFWSFLLFKSCTLLQIPSQMIHLLTLVTIMILLLNPIQLFFLDFQLSFGLTFALAWFNYVATQKSYIA